MSYTHATAKNPKVFPSAAAGASISVPGTAWANSAWIEIVPAATVTNRINVTHLVVIHDGGTGVEFEVDLGIGASGSEAVAATVKGAVHSLLGKDGLMGFAVPIDIAASTRLSARIRCESTTAGTFVVAVQYHESEFKIIGNYAASGGVTFGGAAVLAKVKNYLATGGVVFAGAAVLAKVKNYAASGGIVFGGAATTSPPVVAPDLSRITHGQLGFKDGLRDFIDFMDSSASQKLVFCEARPGKLITSWASFSPGVFVAPCDVQIDGLVRDVVAVASIAEPSLTRVETLALCQSTPGSYYYDPEAASSGRSWDYGLDWWDDSSQSWDLFRALYVHLSNGSNPNDTVVSASLGIYVGAVGVVQPDLGDSKVTDPGLEVAGLPAWTLSASAGCTAARTTSVYRSGAASLQLQATGATNPVIYGEQAATACVLGAFYRVAVLYRTEPGNQVLLFIRFGTGGNYVQSNGRDYDTSDGVQLADTNGEWRWAVLDVRAWTSATFTLRVQAKATGTPLSGIAYIDFADVRRIWRYNYYEPRLGENAIPALELGGNGVFFGGKRVGSGDVEIINADGRLDYATGNLDWENHEVRVWVGGKFPDGAEMPWNDHRRQFNGLIQQLSGDDVSFTLSIDDTRAFMHRDIPRVAYSSFITPGMDPRIEATPRPILLGRKTNISPGRLSKTATGYGTYEVCYTADAPNGIKAIDAVYVYVDSAGAELKDSTRRLSLVAGTDYSSDLAAGTVTVLKDVGPYEVVAGKSDSLDFKIGAPTLLANLTAGLYKAAALATHIAAQMTAAAGTAITCTYSDSTHLFTIAKGSGTLELLLSTGTNKDRSFRALIGFTSSADLTAALSYTGDKATFTDPDKETTLRVDAQGFKDDAAGTYTGSANALVSLGPDIVRLLWRVYLGYPLALIDAPSFLAARTSAPEALGIFAKSVISTNNIFNQIEISCLSDIVIDGTGTVYFLRYSNTLDAAARTLYDRDYLAFREVRTVRDVYSDVRVNFDQDPTSGGFMVRSVSTAAVKVQRGTVQPNAFETYLITPNDAQVRAGHIAQLASGARIATIATKAQLADLKPAQQIKLTRTRASLDPSGALSAKTYRARALRFSYLQGRCEADVVEHVQLS